MFYLTNIHLHVAGSLPPPKKPKPNWVQISVSNSLPLPPPPSYLLAREKIYPGSPWLVLVYTCFPYISSILLILSVLLQRFFNILIWITTVQVRKWRWGHPRIYPQTPHCRTPVNSSQNSDREASILALIFVILSKLLYATVFLIVDWWSHTAMIYDSLLVRANFC